MKLKALIWNRYRSFKERQKVELAPLTVIIGKNGSGKSVISRLPLILSSGVKAAALNNATDVFASHFVDDEALEALEQEDFDAFVRVRENSILDVERRFLRGYGLGFDLAAVRNNEEVDSDE